MWPPNRIFAHGKETCAGSSRRNPVGRISRSAQADTLRGRGRAERTAYPDRAHRARRKARYSRHRAAARQVLQDRRGFLDEYSGPLRSRNGRGRARAADQEDRVLQGGVRGCSQPTGVTARLVLVANNRAVEALRQPDWTLDPARALRRFETVPGGDLAR